MKFQNPSFLFLALDFLNGLTDTRTHKPKPICSPLFQSWGHKNVYPCKPLFYYIKVGCKGSTLHGHDSMMQNLCLEDEISTGKS